MAKTKAELQSDANKYRRAVTAMRKAHNEGRFPDAIRIAMDACDYIDGMMQFEKRFEKHGERKHVEIIEYIFEHAPLVFDRSSLETLREMLKSQKRIDKNTTADLGKDLEQAAALMWDAHRLWTVLDEAAVVHQDKLPTNLGGKQERWGGIAEAWGRLGLIQRIPNGESYRLSLTTRVTTQIRGKCPACGATGKSTMGTFLKEITCPKCAATVTFVMLPLAAKSVG